MESETTVEWADVLFSILFRAKVLLKRFWWIFLFTISIGIAYQAYRQLSKETLYVSYAQMIVSGRIALPEGAVYREELSNFFGTQISLMKSSKVQSRALDRVLALHPDLDPVKVSMNVSQSPESSIFMLSSEGTSGPYVQAFLDAAMEEYMNFKREMRAQTAESTFLSITDQVIQIKADVSRLEDARFAFQEDNNIVFIQEQGSSAGSHLARLNDEYSELKVQFARLANIPDEVGPDEEFPPEFEQVLLDPEFQVVSDEYLEVSDALSRLKAERDETAIYMKSNHPKLVELDLEIDRQEGLLKIVRRQALNQVRDKKRYLSSELASLEIAVKEWEGKALEYSRKLAEFERINSQLDRLKKLHDQLLASTQSIDINRNLAQETVSILEHASEPIPIRVSFAKQILMGAAVGLVLGVGLIILAGNLDSRVVSTEDISQRYEEPVLGVVPKEKPDASDKLGLLKPNDERVAFAEACRNIRSSMLYLNQDGFRPQTLLVTSSVPGEGKTTISGNLSVALAFAASRTLLIDADMRRGRLHDVFEVPASPGLSELIQGDITLEGAIQKTHVENLDLITCGQYPSHPGDMLMSSRLEDIVEELKPRYDFILFDTPPVLATDDTPGFASKFDALIFVVRSGFTRTQHVKTALKNLHARKVPFYGFVLNGMDTQVLGFYRYSYGDYYTSLTDLDDE